MIATTWYIEYTSAILDIFYSIFYRSVKHLSVFETFQKKELLYVLWYKQKIYQNINALYSQHHNPGYFPYIIFNNAVYMHTEFKFTETVSVKLRVRHIYRNESIPQSQQCSAPCHSTLSPHCSLKHEHQRVSKLN